MTEAQLRIELERAYRALRAFAPGVPRGPEVNQAMLAYHSPVVAAAVRFVDEGALDGAEYFIGKHVSVLHETLAKVWKDNP